MNKNMPNKHGKSFAVIIDGGCGKIFFISLKEILWDFLYSINLYASTSLGQTH